MTISCFTGLFIGGLMRLPGNQQRFLEVTVPGQEIVPHIPNAVKAQILIFTLWFLFELNKRDTVLVNCTGAGRLI